MKKFYVSVDIGTDSVGIACTDENYNLLRAKRKDLWAVRLFDESKDAKERRMKRTARRRLDRRKKRIDYLQGIFAPFMSDDKFFIRLNNSGFCEEDKSEGLNSKYAIFADSNYTDVEFYKTYPTIFHLRNALAEGKKINDLRHYYLALHHIIKYRGHFLFEGENVGNIRNLRELIARFNESYQSVFGDKVECIDVDLVDEFKCIAFERIGIKDKRKKACEVLSLKNESLKELVAFMFGAKVNANVIFDKEEYAGEKLSLKELDDEKFLEKSEIFDDEEFDLLSAARAIYNYFLFEKVLGEGNDSVSKAMIALYEKHKRDLRELKDFVKEHAKSEYHKIFRSVDEKNNYASYIGYSKNKNEKKKVVKKCNDPDEFYKFIKEVLPKEKYASEFIDKVYDDIENGTYMPLIIRADKGIFPHQINYSELKLILDNLESNYPEFALKGEDGFSAIEKIEKLFLFKIPYYIGPLNDAHGSEEKGAWVKRKEGKENIAITPWNYNEVVDEMGSNERFIRRMTNKCSYIFGEDVLPKTSMYYQAYDVLSQIDKLKLDEFPITVELKKAIFHDLFLTRKKVSVKNIKDYLISRGLADKTVVISGAFDGDIKASMSSYVLLKNMLGELVDKEPQIAEDIILWHTLNTDKKIVEQQIKEKYGNIPVVKEKIKALKGITSFKEFGRLSKKLICELGAGLDYNTGVVWSLLEIMYNTNYNFNEIYYSADYSFYKVINIENGERSEEVAIDDVNELYVSPMVRRGVWQTILMVDEYAKAVGKAPDKIFVEVTRKKEKDKGRTQSRRAQITELYKTLRGDCKDIDALVGELNGKTDMQLRQERLFLYFMQCGRCAYTGKRITLDELSSDTYDVDHIVPRSITKDDSLDNKVLVLREKNAQKSNQYPIPNGFTDQQGFWKYLNDKKLMSGKKLMSDKKYKLLMRTKPLSDDDFNDFVNRQIVVTSQTVKAVAELLTRKYSKYGTKIVYSKADNVNQFKQKFNIVKCRETNDLHHARDAYLNIVVGNIYDTKFSNAREYFYRDKEGAWREYNLEKIFDYPVKNAWSGKEQIAQIKAVLAKPSMTVTRYAYTVKDKFYDETIYGKDDSGISAPRKQSYPYNLKDKNGNYKYGGYKSLSTAYFAIVKSTDKKGNEIKTIENIPVLVDYAIKAGQTTLVDYLLSRGINNPNVLVPKVKIKTLVSINGYKVYLAGVTGPTIILHNAQQWYASSEIDKYIKDIVKILELDKNGKLPSEEKEQDEIVVSTNRNGGITGIITRDQNLALYDKIIKTLSLDGYSGLTSVRSFRDKIIKKRSVFESKKTFEQAKVLVQLARFMKCNGENADLTLLGEGSRCGIFTINKNITNVDFEIINYSPCGLTVKRRKV